MPRLALLLLVLLAPAAFAQPAVRPSSAETEARLRDLQRQIAADEDRVARAREAENVTLSTLTTLEREIASREALVSTYGLRVGQLRVESDSLGRTLALLTNDLVRLRGQYRGRAVHAYTHGRLNDLALLFSARSVTEMVRRARYLRRFADVRRRRYAALERVATALTRRQSEIAAAERAQGQMLQEAQGEQQNLSGLYGRRQSVVDGLRSQRSALEAALARNTEAARALEGEIRRTVTADTERRRRTATPADDAAFTALSGEFSSARGRLPWPTSGVVTQPFGEIVNPVTRTKTPNPGIVIATEAGAPVRAVFGGTVARVDAMPEFGQYVLVSHGEYQTLYANLSGVAVSRGERLRAGATIGQAGTDRQPRGAGLFFSVFRSGEPVNPARWLVAR